MQFRRGNVRQEINAQRTAALRAGAGKIRRNFKRAVARNAEIGEKDIAAFARKFFSARKKQHFSVEHAHAFQGAHIFLGAAQLYQRGKNGRERMPQRLRQRGTVAVGAEIFRGFSARTDQRVFAKIISAALRTYFDRAPRFAHALHEFSRENFYAAARGFPAQRVGYGGSLTGKRGYPAPPVRQSKHARRG